jgi:aminoglycoside phosphotransferase family enzyme
LNASSPVAFLSRPDAYPGPPDRVERIETHFAWVFLAGDRAYKLKKPTSTRGMDWSTPEARERACREELRLNRRLSPFTYLGVMPLTETDGGLQLNGTGPVVDWLVVMRRLDAQRMLNTALADRTLTRSDLDAIVALLVSFYRSQPPLQLTAESYRERVEARMQQRLGELLRPEFALQSQVLEALARELPASFRAVAHELGERASAGRIIEVHGDLRAEHVWLGPPVQIIDALEVHDELRWLDAAEEIGMLALECESASAAWASTHLRTRYRHLAADPISDALFDFYQALRGINRAMLASWHLEDPEQFPDPAPWRARALSDMQGALRHCPAAAECERHTKPST